MRLAATVLLALALVAGAAPAQAATPGACPGGALTTDTFATAGVGGLYWLENMGFDGSGGMWVSELQQNRIVRYDAQGKPGSSVEVASPGATLLRDGRMYALFGDTLAAADAGVVTFDPAATQPTTAPFAAGLGMANGGAFDAAANLYVADSVNGLVARITPAGEVTKDWLHAAGADGVARIGDTLYVTQLTDPRSTILAVPIAHPEQAKPVAQLSDAAAGNKLLDDLAVGPDGRLYVASNRGELIRVDPADGASCILASGLPIIDSVRFAEAFAPFGDHDLFMTSETGVIIHARIPGTTTVPAARRPKIRLRIRPRHVRVGRRVRVRVMSTAASCRTGVRLRGRTIGRRTRIRFRRAGGHVLVARKAGCRPGRAVVRVRRRTKHVS